MQDGELKIEESAGVRNAAAVVATATATATARQLPHEAQGTRRADFAANVAMGGAHAVVDGVLHESSEEERNWRMAMMTVCAGVLKRTVEELSELYDAESREAKQLYRSKFLRFAQLPIDLQPRDFPDYVIMSTLQVCDIFAMQNARSWLFNIMDRDGSGMIRREEFLRYAPLMYPLCDPAVSRYVLTSLLNAQQLADDKRTASSSNDGRARDAVKSPAASDPPEAQTPANEAYTSVSGAVLGALSLSRSQAQAADKIEPEASQAGWGSAATLPSVPSGCLRYEVWKMYFDKLKSVYDVYDAQWETAKASVGLDPCEPLIHSSGALDHSETIPVVGRLYLSERYLVFMSGVGARNYVIRLSCVSVVDTTTLSFTMRDCIQIHVEPELRSVLKRDAGIASSMAPGSSASSTTTGAVSATTAGHKGTGSIGEGGGAGSAADASAFSNASAVASQAQAASNLVKLYSISGEPIIFSFPEFGETKMRDRWLAYVRELVASHQLHVHYGFGSSGRPPPHEETEWSPEAMSSPFRNDVPPPLLSVAAALNILRSKALSAALGRTTWLLMLFSNLDDHGEAVKYYVDSIRNAKSADRQSWVTRTVQTIVENMEINSRLYEITEDEPFDVQKLGEVMIRFWELVQPVVQAYELYESLLHWRNPPASILALLSCIFLAYMNWVKFLPSIALFVYVALLLALRVKLVGLRGSDAALAAASQHARATGMYEFVKSVHDALQAFQNAFSRYNKQLGKLETLHTWGVPRLTWTLVLGAVVASLLLLIVPARFLFFVLTLDVFTRHFRHPASAADDYWESIPESVQRGKMKKRPAAGSTQRSGKQKVT